jgi:hypothetical protein
VTVTLAENGKATWSTDGVADKGHLALRYRWYGRLKFSIPAGVLDEPARSKFAVTGSTTLTATWTGELNGKKLSGPYSGAYRCRYFGRRVPGRVTATLMNGRARGVLLLILHARGEGFFPAKGRGATVSCNSQVGRLGPTHFEPSWLFRDNLQDHGRLTSDTAVIAVSSALLSEGSASVTFPHEFGTVDQPLRQKLAWNNKGRLTLRAH